MPVRKATSLLFIGFISNGFYHSTDKLSTALMFLCTMNNVPENVTNGGYQSKLQAYHRR